VYCSMSILRGWSLWPLKFDTFSTLLGVAGHGQLSCVVLVSIGKVGKVEYQSMQNVVNGDHLLGWMMYHLSAVPLTWKRMASSIFPGRRCLLMLIDTCIGEKCLSLE
jgi:hypothetical protein